MNKFKMQLINDCRLNRKNLLNPVLLFVILDLLAIISFFIFKSKLGLDYQDMISFDIQTEIGTDDFMQSAWYLIGMGVLGFAGLVQVIVAMSIGNQSLNLDRYKKCEIFYRSQPVSVWQYSTSKYIVAIVGPIVVMFFIGLINLLLTIPFLYPLIKFNFADAISGLWLSMLIYSKSIIVLGSLGFLVSAIFKEKATMKLILFLMAIQGTIYFAHFSIGTPAFNLFGYIVKLINPLSGIATLDANFSNNGMESLNSIMEFRQMFNPRVLFINWHSALQILASGLFYVLAVLIYKRREVN